MKTVFVIGAVRGRGNGVAEKFGKENFRVILMARNEAHLKNYAEEFLRKGIEVHTQAADVSKFDGFTRVFREMIKKIRYARCAFL